MGTIYLHCIFKHRIFHIEWNIAANTLSYVIPQGSPDKKIDHYIPKEVSPNVVQNPDRRSKDHKELEKRHTEEDKFNKRCGLDLC